jgi:hypothetical protein
MLLQSRSVCSQSATKTINPDPATIVAGDWVDVTITVDGHSLKSPDPVPFDAMLVIDESGSMASNDPNCLRIAAARDFVNQAAQAGVGIRIGIVTFGDDSKLVRALTSDYATLLADLNQTVPNSAIPILCLTDGAT